MVGSGPGMGHNSRQASTQQGAQRFQGLTENPFAFLPLCPSVLVVSIGVGKGGAGGAEPPQLQIRGG